ncbi:restriction endonuclease subunit S [uncultured Marixanthomonas sp.]|uniref:restriction endonuclease subunit S n=1 Tax=uncultured Marixanthomonas sp. TaxID=757245 RepID=UPI0030DAA438|tara:strand:- start:133249 stop:134571 length:1323 start_codon:yes stop_codon:yes gene_type:complete
MVETENKDKVAERNRSYENYKKSGISWLEDIPAHWKLKRFKHIFHEKKKTTNVELNCGSISFGKVVYKDDDKVPESTKSSYQVLSTGEFLINPLNLNYDLISLRIALSDKDVVVSSGYIVIQNIIKIDKSYFKWLLHIFDVAFMKTLGAGVRQTLSFNHIANSEFVYPPLLEQTKIAQFLDDKTTKIDAAIGIKEQQIDLLKERKQILIHKAVTRGLDDNVTLKDSGVEWIGEIPEHWEVKALRYISDSFPSNVDKHSKPTEKEVRLCNYTDVYKNDYITDDMDLMIATATEDQIKKFRLFKGDIVITKDSETASDIAVPTYIVEELTNVVCGYHLSVIKPNKDIYGQYLFRALQCKAFNVQFEIESNGITRVGLGTSDMRKAKFLVPPLSEQKQISFYIETASQKIETAISIKEQEIEKLKEYKGSLINSVVTGKIKVC